MDGAKLSYFESGAGTSASNKRIAYLNGSDVNWWLRSPYTNRTNYVWYVRADGVYNDYYATISRGIRPAIILDPDFIVTDDMLA